MKTGVVILNWNTKDYLRRFLPSVLEACAVRKRGEVFLPEGDADVIVADSASTDGSLEFMREAFPGVRIIALEENFGFTGGYNKALSSLEGYEYFVLLNSDIEVPSTWLTPLVEWMDSHPECGACSPKLLSWYDHIQFEYAGAAGGLLDRYGYSFCRGRVLGHVEKDQGQYDRPKNVFWVSGASLMIRASLFKTLGGLDSRFFAHFEEIDLCWRLQLEGYKVTVVPASEAWHLGGGTLPQTSPFKLKLNYRNNLLMLDNNLQRTFELSLSPKKAARKASARIFVRMVLDGLSAAVYLLEGKTSYFKAVIDAHKEFRVLRRQKVPDTSSAKAMPELWYQGWIIPAALLKGKSIFVKIRRIEG